LNPNSNVSDLSTEAIFPILADPEATNFLSNFLQNSVISGASTNRAGILVTHCSEAIFFSQPFALLNSFDIVQMGHSMPNQPILSKNLT